MVVYFSLKIGGTEIYAYFCDQQASEGECRLEGIEVELFVLCGQPHGQCIGSLPYVAVNDFEY